MAQIHLIEEPAMTLGVSDTSCLALSLDRMLLVEDGPAMLVTITEREGIDQ